MDLSSRGGVDEYRKMLVVRIFVPAFSLLRSDAEVGQIYGVASSSLATASLSRSPIRLSSQAGVVVTALKRTDAVDQPTNNWTHPESLRENHGSSKELERVRMIHPRAPSTASRVSRVFQLAQRSGGTSGRCSCGPHPAPDGTRHGPLGHICRFRNRGNRLW